jgi:hypothetical protein
MNKIIVHTPQNEISKNYRYYNIFFSNFIDFLKTKFDVEEDTYFEFANSKSYNLSLLSEITKSDLLECEMIIENSSKKEFVVLSVSDSLTGAILNHQSNPFCKKILVSQFNEDVLKTHSSEEHFHKFKPWVYFPYNNFDLNSKYEKRKNIPNFIDKFCFWGTSMEDRKIIKHFNSEYFDGGLPIGDFDSYSDKLISYKVALSIAGRAEFCYRDIENFGMGVPIIRFEYINKMSPPLIPNFHYISIKRPNELIWDRLGDLEHAKMIEERFLEVKDDKDFLNFISENSRKYYLDNLSLSGSIKNTYYALELNKWETQREFSDTNNEVKNMKKIISFCLYGSDYRYTNGIICNIELAQSIYPDWICRIYYGNSVPENVIEKIKNYPNTELVLMEEGGDKLFPMIWRFLAIDDDDVEVMISRDADSRLSYREKKCVDIFLESDFLFHSIRDNPSHPDVMGGMWGIKKNNRINVNNLSKGWNGIVYDFDQKFLREKIVPLFQDSLLTHCSTYLNNFPVEKTNDFFVGGWWPADNYGKPNNFIFF